MMKPSKTQVLQGRKSAPRSGAVPADIHAPVETVAEVCCNSALSAGGFLLGLKVSMPAPVPGQFVMLGLPGNTAPLLRRPFSVLGHDSTRELLEIHYSVEGAGTRLLSGLGQGQTLNLLGPLGRPFPESEAWLRVLVAGGRGIAPLIFFAGKMGSSGRVLFLAGARTADELVLLERIKATEIFVSTDDGSLGKRGTVIALLRSLGPSIDSMCQGGGISSEGAMGKKGASHPGSAVGLRGAARGGGYARKGGSTRSVDDACSRVVLYGCGPAGMLSALHSYAVSKSVPCFVSLEARMACGVGVCQGCAIKVAGSRYALVCKDGPVFESRLVDWTEYEGA